MARNCWKLLQIMLQSYIQKKIQLQIFSIILCKTIRKIKIFCFKKKIFPRLFFLLKIEPFFHVKIRQFFIELSGFKDKVIWKLEFEASNQFLGWGIIYKRLKEEGKDGWEHERSEKIFKCLWLGVECVERGVWELSTRVSHALTQGWEGDKEP